MEKYVEELLKKASEAPEAHNAMHFAQAACNAANAMCSLASEKQSQKQLKQ